MEGKEGKKIACCGAKENKQRKWEVEKERGVTEKLQREKDRHCPFLSN